MNSGSLLVFFFSDWNVFVFITYYFAFGDD